MENTLCRRLIVLGLLAAFTGCLCAIPALAADDRRPNFIVISCDNLGYGDIGPFGSKLHRTPHLDQLARQGRKFTHFYVTAGVCTPSRASLMTGCYAQRVGMHHNPRDGHVLRPVSPYGLHPDEVTIAEVLKQQDYATAIIGKWHLGDQAEFLPARQGFDAFFGIPYSDDMTAAVGRRLGERLDGHRWPPLPLMENERVVQAPADRNTLTREYTERALQFIESHREEPFFLYLAHAMPGSTRAPFASEAFRGKSRGGPWGDAVEEIDWSTGAIVEKLAELGLAENTLILWTSDNGAPLAQDAGSPSRGSNRPLYGRGYTTAEGAFRVPTIFCWQGKIPAGTVCDSLATTMDMLPTFARLAGGKPPESRKIDGHDIRPLLFAAEDATTPYEAFYYYHQDQLQAVRSGRWKLFVPLDSFSRHPHFKHPSKQPLLFDLKNVGSAHNVAARHPGVVKRLLALAEAARADLGDREMRGKGQRPPGRISAPQPQVLTAQ